MGKGVAGLNSGGRRGRELMPSGSGCKVDAIPSKFYWIRLLGFGGRVVDHTPL